MYIFPKFILPIFISQVRVVPAIEKARQMEIPTVQGTTKEK
jgi:hypothetical protein